MNPSQDRLDVATEEDSRTKALNGLIKANRLDYVIPKSLNVAVNTHWASHVSHGRSEYTAGDCIQITLNTGESYLAPKCAALVFTLSRSASAKLANSAIDLFKSIKICSNSGTQVYSANNVNSRVATTEVFEMDDSQLASVASLYGRGDTSTTSDVKYIIPLYKMCGLFNSSKLMPNLLAQGLKLEFQIESDVNKALDWDAAPAGTITIKDPKIFTYNVQLSDSVLRQLTKVASSKGLEYMFHQYEDVTSSVSNSKVVIDSKRALSRTVNTFVKFIDIADNSAAEAVKNSFASRALDTSEWYFQYGGLSLPQGCGAMGTEETYFYALHSNEASQDMRRDCSVSKTEFASTYGSHWISLERSHVVALSGRPISVGHLLSFLGTIGGAIPTNGVRVELFVKFVSVLNIGIGSTVLKV